MSRSSRPATSCPDVGQGERRRGRHASPLGQLGRRPPPARRVDGAVVDDRQEPGLDAAAALLVARGIPPGADEGVLDDVLGERRVAGDPAWPGQRPSICIARTGSRSLRGRPPAIRSSAARSASSAAVASRPGTGVDGRFTDGCAPARALVQSWCRCRARIAASPAATTASTGAVASITTNRLRVLGGQDAIALADTAVVVEVEARLEARLLVGLLPGEADLDGDVEEQRQVGPQADRSRRPGAHGAWRSTGRRRSPGRPASSRRAARPARPGPRSSAGRITSATSCARAALNRSASVRGSSGGSVGSWSRTIRRTRSPTLVPPGSRVARTSIPRPTSASRRRPATSVLPAPSGPSTVMNQPRPALASRSLTAASVPDGNRTAGRDPRATRPAPVGRGSPGAGRTPG